MFAPMSDTPSPTEILAFYAEAGVDVMLEDAPVDRFAETAREAEVAKVAAERATPPSKPARRTPPSADAPSATATRTARMTPEQKLNVPDEQAIADARSLAASANDLIELREAVEQFRGINLAFTAKNPVFADGNPGGALMVVGEAPGRDEDIEGLPFVGRSGKLLDRILHAIGRDRKDTYITNVIYWRPPGNRKPTLHEVHICQAFVERQIELANPRALLLTGNTPTQTLLETREGITKMRGRWREYTPPGGARAIPALPTLHPAFLLRQPQQKRLIWQDVLAMKRRLRELEAGPLAG